MFDDIRDLYNATIVERARHPLHGHRLELFDATAKGDNPMCGDRVQVWLRHDENGRIAEAGFEARGCDISKASADLMADAVAGRDPAAARRLCEAFRHMVQSGACPDSAAAPDCDEAPDCDKALAALRPLASVHEYPSRVKCATLPWHALIAALDGAGQASSESSNE
jgi:nitrogen fixation NifU-like protein